MFADRHAAGEGDEVDVRTGQQFAADLGRIAGHHRQHFRRQPGLVQDVGEREGGQRCLLARLEHDAVVGGHGGGHLVDHLIQGMVERRDGGDGAEQRFSQRIDLAPLAVGGEIAGKHLGIVDQGLVGREQQHIRGASHLVIGVLEAQSRLERDQAGNLFAARGNEGPGAHENGVARVARERGAVAARDAQRPFDVLDAGLRHRAGQRTAVGVTDFDHPVAEHPLARDAQRLPYRLVQCR